MTRERKYNDLRNNRIGETGIGETGIGERGIGETGIGETGTTHILMWVTIEIVVSKTNHDNLNYTATGKGNDYVWS